MSIYIIIIGMFFATYIPRAIPAAVIDKMKYGAKMEKFLSLIPFTAMAALIFPGVLNTDPNYPVIGIVGALAAVLLSLRKLPIAFIIIGAVAIDILLYSICTI